MHEPNDITSLSPINGGTRLVEEMPRDASGALPIWEGTPIPAPSSQLSGLKINVCALLGVCDEM